MYYNPDCREHPLAKKKWSYLHFSSIFFYIFNFFFIYCHFPEVKPSPTIYWNDCFNTIREWSSGGIYIGITLSGCLSICPSVHLPVCLSDSIPSVYMILSTHVLGNGCIDFSENVNTNYLSSEDVHLEFSYWLDNFSSFYKLFSVFGISRFFNNKK